MLFRKIGDRLFIGEDEDRVEVMVLSIDRHKVRLGFVAPKHVQISRDDMKQPKQEREGE